MAEDICWSHNAQAYVLHKLTFECLSHPVAHFQPRSIPIPVLDVLNAIDSRCTCRAGQPAGPLFSTPGNARAGSGHESSLRRNLVVHRCVAPDQPTLVTCRVQDKQRGFGVKSWLAEFGGKKNSYGLLRGWNFELSVYYFESQSPSRSLSLALSSSLSVYELGLASLRERFFRGNAALCALKWYQDLKVELFAVGVWILC